ncbi:glycosyl hydrolase family 47 domain-containing protein [Trichoderma breve]|uniref:alpha-1,2-Mannosidase n=1 Tax=Trichoderma breve TaxID=2034170 RepID=A0A9W9B5A4_9HYPO|nr:glycosyl hydrolase family 47 domain-containing protein [Trichoderma breve]KAJ4856630.1 glycosyl hydrolase family 47 domain-containing protein [Trichoderma breve]
MLPIVRVRGYAWVALIATLLLIYFWSSSSVSPSPPPVPNWRTPKYNSYFWKTLPVHYPPKSIRPLPTTSPVKYPKIQTSFAKESPTARKTRQARQLAVKDVFSKCWASYKEHAWTADELAPVSGGKKNPFGGWAATLVDSLDTLWIMGMKPEFDDAVTAAHAIDFTKTALDEVNVFETNIRYLGGFLSAYDLSGDSRLLDKAVEVGEMLYKAFDTPNRMPITRWDIHAAMDGKKQEAHPSVLVAEIGSLSMEFTRLSLITRDPKWFDAVQRIMDGMAAQQKSTALPGLWPLVVSAQSEIYNVGDAFTMGAMADSVYEYLPKMSALIGGQLPIYQEMYELAATTATKHNLFRPMTPKNDDILISGTVKADKGTVVSLDPQGQHLVCFLGGLMALGGKMFNRPQDVSAATKLVDGCIWTYKALPHGIMPETFHMLPCPSASASCQWDEAAWKKEVLRRASDPGSSTADDIIKRDRLPPGFTSIPDRRYILRPEAIESVFVLYRATGRPDLVESAWDMFTAVNSTTSTALANSAVWDVTLPSDQLPDRSDSMESFWLGETLKYFYLVFSEPNTINLDEYVFNTEAHPFKRLIR